MAEEEGADNEIENPEPAAFSDVSGEGAPLVIYDEVLLPVRKPPEESSEEFEMLTNELTELMEELKSLHKVFYFE